jgi:hypothetical protein
MLKDRALPQLRVKQPHVLVIETKSIKIILGV